MDGKKRHGDWSDTPPDTPPQLSAGFEADLQNLIHEDHRKCMRSIKCSRNIDIVFLSIRLRPFCSPSPLSPLTAISIIPCSDLSIGSWRRIATPAGKHDLIAYVCETKRCLTWFIHSAGYGFKMEIPFDTITHTDFRNAAPGEGLASFTLSQPPMFYLEHIASPRVGGAPIKTWKKCADWTEGTQASQVLRHDLIGSAVLLAHLLQDLQNYRTRSNIRLLNPSTYGGGDPSGAGLQLPQPPLASLHSDAYAGPMQRPSYFGHSRKRSNSGPPAFTHGVSSYVDHAFPSVNTASVSGNSGPHSAGFATTSFSNMQDRPPNTMSYGQNYNHRMVNDFMSADVQQSSQPAAHQQPSPISDYSNIPISHSSTHRSFSSTPSTTTQFSFPPGRSSPPFQLNSFQRHSAPTSAQQSGFVTPSPPLMSGSYQPQTVGGSMGDGSLTNLPDHGSIAHPRAQGPPLPPLDLSSLPSSLPYYAQDEVQSRLSEYPTGRPDASTLVGPMGASSSSPPMAAEPQHNPLSSTLD